MTSSYINIHLENTPNLQQTHFNLGIYRFTDMRSTIKLRLLLINIYAVVDIIYE